MADLIINDDNFESFVEDPTVAGSRKSRGLVPRDMEAHPVGAYSSSRPWSHDMPTIPRNEWPERINEMEADKSRLSDIRNRALNGSPFPSLDQNGQGFCWAYSTTAAVMLLRARDNMPYVRLSAHAVACKIYNFQDRGAWGALSLDFIAENGVPSVDYWHEKSMARHFDNPETWEDAKKYRVAEGWQDLSVAAYDRKLAFDQVMSALLARTPVVLDYMWWGHSVCGMDAVDVDPSRGLNDPKRWGIRIINSWTDNWGENGTAVLQGDKAIPMGASCPRAVVYS